MNKHTPGPWKVYYWGTNDVLGENESPFILKTSREVDLLAECYANARMMQAAPDLYAALKNLVEQDECNRPDGRPLLDCDTAYAALKKARERTW